MRFLNKIIFINSAASNYAEINLDGNVHLIGTQGVGKSTLLRAILFFYNADKTKLGIPREKKNFDQYYFPFANSYIVYEVKREDTIFSVIASKSQGRVSFRFFDAKYHQDYFIDETGKAFLPQEQREKGFGREVFYTRIVTNYEEYRNIIYGNNKGLASEFRKYALLESRQYQNIPRTIQNVFLNSKLDAAFIKETIIKSLSEEEIKIDLSTYANNHLRNFETELNDIKIWSQTNKAGKTIVRSQAEAVSNANRDFLFLEQELIHYTKQLGWYLNDIKISRPKLEEELKKAREEENKYNKGLNSLQANFKKEQQSLNTRIGVLSIKLKDLNEKRTEYKAKNIDDILPRIEKKPEQEFSKQNLQEERKLLSRKFEAIEDKFQAQINQLEAQLEKFQNKNASENLEQRETFATFKENLDGKYRGIITQIESQHAGSLETVENELQEIGDSLHRLGLQEVEIKHRRFFEPELEHLKTEHTALTGKISRTETAIENSRNRRSHLKKQWELEVKEAENSHKFSNEEINKNLQEIEQKILATQTKLTDSQGSFFEWLNTNISDWEKSIGKVIDEEKVLFSKDLGPKIAETSTGNFYGVALDLSVINKTVKTYTDYEKDLQIFSKEAREQQNLKSEIKEKLINEKLNLKKKYGLKINKLSDEISTQEYHREQYSQALLRTENEVDQLKKKAGSAKKKALQKIQEDRNGLNERKREAEKTLKKLETRVKREVAAKKKEQKDLLLQEQNELVYRQKKLEEAVREKKNETADRIQQIKDEEKSELNKKGADTERIALLDKRLKEVDDELYFIQTNAALAIEYQKDKRELFDKEPEFRSQRSLLNKELEKLQGDYGQKEQLLQDKLNSQQELVEHLKLKKEQIKNDLDQYQKYDKLEWFLELEKYLKEYTEEDRTNLNGTEILDNLKDKHYKRSEKLNLLKERITKFTGNFGEDNIFNFRTRFNNTADFLNFADDLKEFLEEDKISEYETRVNERFAHIIRQIGKETGEMLSKEGEINQVIRKINTDFESKNFVGAIKSMEMRTVESSNRIMKLLVDIKMFNDENGMLLGESNLFSSEDQNTSNEKAVKLLKQLLMEINLYKADELKLSDSFGLEFRIVENENDSQWVEKLSNVGSEGTDVLVKAMINIMLLNVFKDNASKKFKDFKLHCMMDEIGRLHPSNVKGILKFANDRNILLINGSPTSYNATDYRYTYILTKNNQNKTSVKRLVRKIPVAKSL